MGNLNYKNENNERKYLSNMRNNQFLKVNNSLLELEKDFIELKEIELKERETKIKREIEELFFKLIIVSIIDLQNSDAWKIQLTIAINIISAKDAEEIKLITIVN